jgi:hypothetical protein
MYVPGGGVMPAPKAAAPNPYEEKPNSSARACETQPSDNVANASSAILARIPSPISKNATLARR